MHPHNYRHLTTDYGHSRMCQRRLNPRPVSRIFVRNVGVNAGGPLAMIVGRDLKGSRFDVLMWARFRLTHTAHAASGCAVAAARCGLQVEGGNDDQGVFT